MRNFFKRIAVRKRGFEALQTVLILGAAFVVIVGLKSLSGPTMTQAKAEITAVLVGSGGGSGGGDAKGAEGGESAPK